MYIPEINFPEFPKVGEFEVKEGKVTVSENFFRKLLIFKAQYKNEILKYNDKKLVMEDYEK